MWWWERGLVHSELSKPPNSGAVEFLTSPHKKTEATWLSDSPRKSLKLRREERPRGLEAGKGQQRRQAFRSAENVHQPDYPAACFTCSGTRRAGRSAGALRTLARSDDTAGSRAGGRRRPPETHARSPLKANWWLDDPGLQKRLFTASGQEELGRGSVTPGRR